LEVKLTDEVKVLFQKGAVTQVVASDPAADTTAVVEAVTG